MSVLEVLDGGTSSSLELNNSVTVIGGLGVDDDVKLHTLVLHDALEGWRKIQCWNNPLSIQRTLEIDPKIVGVENLELAD